MLVHEIGLARQNISPELDLHEHGVYGYPEFVVNRGMGSMSSVPPGAVAAPPAGSTTHA